MTEIVVEDLTEVTKRVTFEVPQERFRNAMDTQLNDLRKNAQIKGFRKGKVPLNIIRAYFKGQVEADVIRQLIDETFSKGLEEKQISAVSVLKIEPHEVKPDEPFTYSAEIEVPPPVDLQQYKGLSLTKEIREVTEDEVLERLESLRDSNARLSPLGANDPLQTGDHAIVTVQAFKQEEPVNALTVEDYRLELGREFFVPGFDEQIEGRTVGSEAEFSVTLPGDFPPQDLAGQTVDFTVSIVDGKRRVLPDLDDDFAKDLGEYETLDALKAYLRDQISASREAEARKDLERQIVDQLVAAHDIAAPASMVDQQVDDVVRQGKMSLARMGINPRELPTPSEEALAELRPEAEKTVKASLITRAVVAEEDLTISDEELAKAIRESAERIGYSEDFFRDQLEGDDLMGSFKSGLLRDKVFDLIIEHANITERVVAPEEKDEEEPAPGVEPS